MAGRRFGARPTQELDMVSATVAPGVNDDAAAGYGVGSGWVDTTHDTCYVCVDATTGAAIWHETDTSGAAHVLLSATHTDTDAHAAVAGDIIIGNDTPHWARLAITVPGGAALLNVLGVVNGETTPTWKVLFDATAPTTIAPSDAATAGTAVVAAHRDHKHGAPATYPATAHAILDSAYHSDALTGSVLDGDIIIGNVTPKWSRLAISVPAATFMNYLGVTNGETRPSWKAAFSAGTPAAIAANNTPLAGTSTYFARLDHVHDLASLGTYTPSNVSADRSYDADATTIDEIADVLGTLIADLQTGGLLA